MMGLALALAACSQDDAPAEKVADAAEEIVAPPAEATPLASGKWAPHDECGEVEGAAPFRRMLAAAVAARDAEALVALSADDVVLDFGAGAGKAELQRRLDDPTQDLWGELDALMTLGCAANEQGGITIPWYFDQDLGDADPYGAWLVAAENVPLYAAPAPDTRQLGTVSWELVEIAEIDPEAARQRAELADGTVGYLPLDKLRSVIDYRLIASSRNGRWRITSLVAGD